MLRLGVFVGLLPIYSLAGAKRSSAIVRKLFSGRNWESEAESDEEALLSEARKPDGLPNRILYPDDPVVCRLADSSSVQQVFDTIVDNADSLGPRRLCQSVVVLWDIQKLYYKIQWGGFLDLNWSDTDVQSNELLKVYIEKRNRHPTFDLLLRLVHSTYPEMDLETLSSTFLFLSKLGLNIRQDALLQEMITALESRIDSSAYPLTALSRYSVALKQYRELWAYLSLVKLLPQIVKKIDDGLITTIEDFHLLTIVMRSCNHVMSSGVFNMYKLFVEKLHRCGMLAHAPPNTIIKALSVLNSPQWVAANTILIRELMLTFVGREDSLKLNQAIYIQKLIQNTSEPRVLMDSLKKVCSNFLTIFETENQKIPASLLSTCISSVAVVEQHRFEKHIKNYVSKEMQLNSIGAYALLPQLKICHNETINMFWTNCFKSVINQGPHTYQHSLLELCDRYINFVNSVSNSYRHYSFEKSMVQIIKKHLLEGPPSIQPRSFLMLSSFILSFGLYWHSAEIPQYIYSKLSGSICQFKARDCLLLSRALRLAVDIKKSLISSAFVEQYVSLITALNTRLIEYMQENKSLSLNDINLIMRTHINIKGTRDGHLYSLILSRLSKVKQEEFSSRLVRNTVYNIMAINCFLPELLDKMVEYVCDNYLHVSGDTMGKLLQACFLFDYKPKNDKLLLLVSKALMRDCHYFNGLSLLQSALSLSYFHYLPMELIQHIFSVPFLETLDEEIKYCYSRENYPSRVRYHLMQLNRVVCLDILEADVPWFHDKYCQQLIAAEPKKMSDFHLDVLDKLINIFGSEEVITKCAVAHYGYVIDFLICMDGYNNIVSRTEEKTSGIRRRIAILLDTEDHTARSDRQACRGTLVLKCRHLEILNYEVLVISSFFWNSMFMSDEGAKIDYLLTTLHLHKADKNV